MVSTSWAEQQKLLYNVKVFEQSVAHNGMKYSPIQAIQFSVVVVVVNKIQPNTAQATQCPNQIVFTNLKTVLWYHGQVSTAS